MPIMNSQVAEDLYNRLLVINEEAFQAGFFDAAYHALASALHCAKLLDSDQPLLRISKLCKEQLAWIDRHHPEYHHSSWSASSRQTGRSIFMTLSLQAETDVKTRTIKSMGKSGQGTE